MFTLYRLAVAERHHSAGVSETHNVKRIGTSAPNAQEREEDRLQYSGKAAQEVGCIDVFSGGVYCRIA